MEESRTGCQYSVVFRLVNLFRRRNCSRLRGLKRFAVEIPRLAASLQQVEWLLGRHKFEQLLGVVFRLFELKTPHLLGRGAETTTRITHLGATPVVYDYRGFGASVNPRCVVLCKIRRWVGFRRCG